MARQQPATRKHLDDALILAHCVGATCQAIADKLGEDFQVVKRHLKKLVAQGLVLEERRGYLRYTKA